MFPFFLAVIGFIGLLCLIKGIKIVPQQQVFVIEHLGRFDRKLEPGLNYLIPFVQRVAYRHSLK